MGRHVQGALIYQNTSLYVVRDLSGPSGGRKARHTLQLQGIYILCRRRSAANKNRVPRTIPEEGGPIPLHRDTTISISIYTIFIGLTRCRKSVKG